MFENTDHKVKEEDPVVVAWVRNNAPGLDVHIMHLFPKSTDNIKKVRFFAVKDYEKALFYKNGEFMGEVRGGIYEIEKQAQTKGTEIVWFDTSINEMPWGFPAENGFPTLDNSMVGLFGDMKLRLSDVRVFYQDVVGGATSGPCKISRTGLRVCCRPRSGTFSRDMSLTRSCVRTGKPLSAKLRQRSPRNSPNTD